MLNKILKHLGFIVISNNKAARIRTELPLYREKLFYSDYDDAICMEKQANFLDSLCERLNPKNSMLNKILKNFGFIVQDASIINELHHNVCELLCNEYTICIEQQAMYIDSLIISLK